MKTLDQITSENFTVNLFSQLSLEAKKIVVQIQANEIEQQKVNIIAKGIGGLYDLLSKQIK